MSDMHAKIWNCEIYFHQFKNKNKSVFLLTYAQGNHNSSIEWLVVNLRNSWCTIITVQLKYYLILYIIDKKIIYLKMENIVCILPSLQPKYSSVIQTLL